MTSSEVEISNMIKKMLSGYDEIDIVESDRSRTILYSGMKLSRGKKYVARKFRDDKNKLYKIVYYEVHSKEDADSLIQELSEKDLTNRMTSLIEYEIIKGE